MSGRGAAVLSFGALAVGLVIFLAFSLVSTRVEKAELEAENHSLALELGKASDRADDCEEALSVMREVSVELRAGGTVISEILGDVAIHGPMAFSQSKADRGLEHIEMANGLTAAVEGVCNG